MKTHPFASEEYSRVFEDAGPALRVPGWNTHVLLQPQVGPDGLRNATGLYPFAALDPDCDVAEGLAFLRERGVRSISIVADPLWSPPVEALRRAFPICAPFKTCYLIDREGGPVRFRKKHRNNLNRANRRCSVGAIRPAEHVDAICELYGRLVERRQVTGIAALSQAQIARLAGLAVPITGVAAFARRRIVAVSLWVRHRDVVYFHLGASSDEGYAIEASYACHAYAIRHFADCRRVCLGPEVGARDSRGYGAAGFKSGFANATTPTYLCSAVLNG